MDFDCFVGIGVFDSGKEMTDSDRYGLIVDAISKMTTGAILSVGVCFFLYVQAQQNIERDRNMGEHLKAWSESSARYAVAMERMVELTEQDGTAMKRIIDLYQLEQKDDRVLLDLERRIRILEGC